MDRSWVSSVTVPGGIHICLMTILFFLPSYIFFCAPKRNKLIFRLIVEETGVGGGPGGYLSLSA